MLNQNVFTMYDGVIYGNAGYAAGGVRNLQTTFGGVRLTTTFTMEGGEIDNNTAIRSDTPLGGNGGGGVSNTAIFNMNGGIISNNIAPRGGGVSNMSPVGEFTMTGGYIYRNTATLPMGPSLGGGVLNMDSTTFIMEGGTISYNISNNRGGGVFTTSDFIMTGGYIQNNFADQQGGGVGLLGRASFDMQGGEISGNTSSIGGGISIPLNTTVQNYGLREGRLQIGSNAVFRNNVGNPMFAIRYRNPADDALYAATIHTTLWSAPFTQGFNNFDIEYWDGTAVQVRPLAFELGGTATNPTTPESINTIWVFQGTPIMDTPGFPASPPTRGGYVFAGWYFNAAFTQALTAATLMPVNNTTRLFARWTALPGHNVTVGTQGSGTATASVSYAAPGTIVTLTATPDVGHSFVRWHVVSGGVVLADEAAGTTTFVMPGGDVQVTAVFMGAPIVYAVNVRGTDASTGDLYSWRVMAHLGGKNEFVVHVFGVNNPPLTVTWSVQGNESAGTFISDTGILTVANDETARSLTVRATSVFNTNVYGYIDVFIVDPAVSHQVNIVCDNFHQTLLIPDGYRLRFNCLHAPHDSEWPDDLRFANTWICAGTGQEYTDYGGSTALIHMPRTFYLGWVCELYNLLPPRHNITINVQGNGRVVTSRDRPEAGMHVNLQAFYWQNFIEWQVVSGGVVLSSTTATGTSFVMPDNDVVITAVFAVAPTNNVIINTQGSGTATADISSAVAGTRINLSATPSAGYQFERWQVVSGGVPLSSTTSSSAHFIMPSNDVEIRAVFVATPIVTQVVVTSGGGTHATVFPGTSRTFNANVIGTNVQIIGVIWTVEGHSSNDTNITTWGSLFVGTDEVEGTIIVRATSRTDPNVSGTMQVIVPFALCPTTRHEITILDFLMYCCHTTSVGVANIHDVRDGYNWLSSVHLHASLVCCCSGFFFREIRDMATGTHYYRSQNIFIREPRIFAPLLMRRVLIDCYCCGYLYIYENHWYGLLEYRSIDVTSQGNGVAVTSHDTAKVGTVVNLTAVPDAGYAFVMWQVLSNGFNLHDAQDASVNFMMPGNSVRVQAIFEPIPSTIANHQVAFMWVMECCCIRNGLGLGEAEIVYGSFVRFDNTGDRLFSATHVVDVYDGYQLRLCCCGSIPFTPLPGVFIGPDRPMIITGAWRDVSTGLEYHAPYALIRGTRVFAPVPLIGIFCCCILGTLDDGVPNDLYMKSEE